LKKITNTIKLLKNKSDIDKKDEEGKTPLYVAAFYKNIQAINLLINHGAKPAKVLAYSNQFLQKNGHEKINEFLSGSKKCAKMIKLY